MTFDKINRRAHLYLGLFLMPWLLMYGVSSFIVIHQKSLGGDKSNSTEPMFEKSYSFPVNLPGSGNNTPEMRALAQEILKDNNLEGAFWVYKNGDNLHIDRFSFRDAIRLDYSIKEQKLKAQRQVMRPQQVAVRMHFRGGYHQPTLLDKTWGVLVDIACAGILVWVLSGLIMWWRLPKFRGWGAIAVAGGFISFFALVLTL